jgi:protein O-mannosyl-transferase
MNRRKRRRPTESGAGRIAVSPEPLQNAGGTPAGARAWWFCLFIVLITLLAYQPVWHAGFIWDDDDYVTQNATLRNLAGLWRIWFEIGAVPQYYPLVHTTYWLEYHLWGLHPLGYHLVNVLLHAGAAILFWRVLLRLQVPGASLAAIIFALHPVQVESVAWITERKNVLSATFYFSAALVYLRFMERTDNRDATRVRWHWYGGALGLYVAALLSKTVTCSLPAALLIVRWWKTGRVERRDILRLLPFFAIGAGLGLITVWVEAHHVGAQGAVWSLSLADRCLIAGRALWFYVSKLVWPERLTFIYPRWEVSAAVWWQWVFPVAFAGLVLGLYMARRRIGRGPVAAVLIFAGTLWPALGFINIYPMRYSFVADHFQYLSSAGLITLGAVWLSRWRRIVPVALTVLLSILTWRQAGVYQNLGTLWRDTLAKNPTSWLTHNNLGNLLFQAGQVDEAIIHFQRALQISPDYAEAHNNLAGALLQGGHADAAIAQIRRALAIDPNYAEAHNNLGIALSQSGRMDEAIAEYRKALEISPGYAEAHNNLGNVLGRRGHRDEAIAHYQQALEIFPGYAEAHNNLGNALLQDGRVTEAIAHFRRALELRPSSTTVHNNLAAALLKNGEARQALAHYEASAEIQPNNPTALSNVAWLLATCPDASIRNGARAIEAAREADRLSGGQNPRITGLLAAAYAEAGRFPEAITTVQQAMRLAAAQNDDALADSLRAQIKLYKAGTPFRDPALAQAANDPSRQ